jgi:hypothetical protein
MKNSHDMMTMKGRDKTVVSLSLEKQARVAGEMGSVHSSRLFLFLSHTSDIWASG